MTIALTGSPKQIEWADTIRTETLAELDAAAITDDERTATAALLAEVTAASWWIETKDIPGYEWPGYLGITAPAVEWRPRTRNTDGVKRRLSSRMATAQRIRDLLDAAGVHRTAYRLAIDLQDGLRISQTDCSGRTDERKAERLALAAQLVAAVTEASRPPHDPGATQTSLANGVAVPIIIDTRTTSDTTAEV